MALQRDLARTMGQVEHLRLRRSAAMVQAWDDWAISAAMENGPSPKRSRTVGTQVNAEMIAAGELDQTTEEATDAPRSSKDIHEAMNVFASGSERRNPADQMADDDGGVMPGDTVRDGPGPLDGDDQEEVGGPQEEELPALQCERPAVAVALNVGGGNSEGVNPPLEVAATVMSEEEACE